MPIAVPPSSENGTSAPSESPISASCARVSAVLRMAAVLAGAPGGVERRLGRIGRHLGLAFQLQDDLLCAFGDPELHGKDRYSDLREGKQTAIIAAARATPEWPRVEALLGEAAFRDFVFALFSERIADLMQLIEEVAFRKLDQRLAALLLGKGQRVHTTHQQLADELGSVREIVSRLLKGFAEQGLVALSREQVEILDPAGLRVLEDLKFKAFEPIGDEIIPVLSRLTANCDCT